MWKTNILDWAFLLAMIAMTVVSSFFDANVYAAVFGFIAGNQLQICIAGSWWGSLRKIYRLDRKCAVDIFEDQM